jgi:hypothetical protein
MGATIVFLMIDILSGLSSKPPCATIAPIAGVALWRSAYIGYRESKRARPYNLTQDKEGFVRWYEASKPYVDSNPVQFTINNASSFLKAVGIMVDEFRHFIEQNTGYRLLWNDNGTSRSEKAAQLLFLGVVKHYCQAHNIDISPEANIGRGPVDFKVSIEGGGLRFMGPIGRTKNLEIPSRREGLNWVTFLKQKKEIPVLMVSF